ncbi:MAG TPA: HlyC/CorC family transporter [Corynebacteriales bacterium]|nr:HlyC/CorC family transporter [Mycobacteriales bacterium]
MSTSAIVSLVAAIICMLVAALCSAQDAALNAASLARAKDMADSGEFGAKKMLRVVVNRQTYVALAVFLTTIFELLATVLFALVFLETVGDRTGAGTGEIWALVYAVTVSILFSYVMGGVSARAMGLRNPYDLLRYTAILLIIFGSVLRPISKFLVFIGNAVTPGKGFKEGPFSTDIELREFVDLAQQKGAVEDDERVMIESVFELGANNARSAMVPRTDMVWIEESKTAGQAARLAVKSGFSRIPVIGETVDDVVGIVYLKDLVAQAYSDDDRGEFVKIAEVMRPAWFVPDSKNLDDLLDEMQLHHNHIAILVDEYGGVAGLITIEDILEEIVGEIADEYDESEVAPIEEVEENVWRVSARVSLDDFAQLTSTTFSEEVEEEVDTVGGLLAFELGRVPLPGARVNNFGLEMLAEAGHDHRGRRKVKTVLVRREEEPTDADNAEAKDKDDDD